MLAFSVDYELSYVPCGERMWRIQLFICSLQWAIAHTVGGAWPWVKSTPPYTDITENIFLYAFLLPLWA